MSSKGRRDRKQISEDLLRKDDETLSNYARQIMDLIKEGTVDLHSTDKGFEVRIKDDVEIKLDGKNENSIEMVSDILGMYSFIMRRRKLDPVVFGLTADFADRLNKFWEYGIQSGLVDEMEIRLNTFAPKMIVSTLDGRKITIYPDELLRGRTLSALEIAFETTDGKDQKRHYFTMSKYEFEAFLKTLAEIHKGISSS